MATTTDSDAIDIALVRADTPAVQQRLHLNNAGAALMPTSVVTAVTDHIQREANMGGYEAAAEMAASTDAVYDEIAALIGAQRDEIALLDNATIAWDQAFYALAFKPGDRILTAQAEYAANYVAFLQRARRDGIIIDVIPNDECGAVDVSALENMLDERVALIAITWVPTNGGLVNPAQAIGRIARRYNVPYLLDACQAVGQMPVDVHELGCDFLSATGRKFLRGPRGTGFLYIRKTWLEKLEPAMLDHFAAVWVTRNKYALRPDARRFETWENAYALRLGLGEAVRYARRLGLAAIQQQAWALADYLRDSLGALHHTQHHDIGVERCAIVSFSVAGLDPNQAQRALRQQGINISVIPPSSTRLDTEARRLPALMRASPHYYNTRDEIDRFITALDALLRN